MEKTLTINISGWVFNINENAYEKLTQYFKKLNTHFKKEEGGDEIVADIEARIAELFKDRTPEQVSVITIDDVDDIMKIMGQPYEMEEESSDESYEPTSHFNKFKKHLFRDPINAHIAGVASGLGKYFNIDPVIIRIIFVILVTTGGIGILIYLGLWLLMPEAASTSDRIRMEGKKVNVKNIESKVKEETEYLKDRLSDFSEEAMGVYHKTGPARKQGLKKIEAFVKAFGRIILRILKFILGLVLFIYGAGLLVGFGILYLNLIPELEFEGFVIQGMSFPAFMSKYIIANEYASITLTALSILVLIPIIMMVFHGIRFLFNLKRNKAVGTIAWQAWVVALIVSIGMSYTTLRAYHKDAINITKYDFEAVQSDTLNIRLNTNSYYQNIFSSDNKTVVSQDNNHPILHDDEIYGEPRLEIIEHDKNTFSLKLYKSSNGKNEEQANLNLENIFYHFEIDSTGLLLDPYFKLDEDSKWRNQEIKLKLYIPEGKAIMIDKNIRRHFRMDYNWRNKLYKKRANNSYWILENGDFNEVEEIQEVIEVMEEPERLTEKKDMEESDIEHTTPETKEQ